MAAPNEISLPQSYETTHLAIWDVKKTTDIFIHCEPDI